MQRIYIALALALTISCAQAAWTTGKLVKAPTVVTADTDYNFTNVTNGSLTLQNTNSGELSLVSQYVNSTDTSALIKWNIWWKKVDTKALTGGVNTTLSIVYPPSIPSAFYSNGYLVSIVFDNTTSITTLQVIQQPLSGSAQLPKITLTNSNNNAINNIVTQIVGKIVVVFYNIGTKVNYTSFTIGGSAGTEYTLTNATTSVNQVTPIWGQALSTSQVLAYWIENGNIYKDAVADFTKGSLSNNNTLTIPPGSTCTLYTTDKKYYGEFCYLLNGTGINTTYIRTSNGTIGQLSTYNSSATTFEGVEPYGQYLAVFLKDAGTNPSSPAHSYEIWNLDTFQPFMNRTIFLNVDASGSMYSRLRVPGGGIYGLLYNNVTANATSSTVNSVNVVQILGSSYLASVLGFVMTIVAGLFLF